MREDLYAALLRKKKPGLLGPMSEVNAAELIGPTTLADALGTAPAPAQGGQVKAPPPAAPPVAPQPPPAAPAATPPPTGMDPSELTQYAAPPTSPPNTQAPPEEDLQAGRDKSDIATAAEKDRQLRNRAVASLAARQAIAGLTQQPLGQGMPTGPTQVSMVEKSQDDRRKRLGEALQAKRQAALDANTLASGEATRIKDLAEAAKAGRPPQSGDPQSLRDLLLSPVYSKALAAKGMTPEAVSSLGEAGLKDLVAQLKTDTTNDATVQAGRESAATAATRALGNAKELKVFENDLPTKPDTETRKQAEALSQVDGMIDRLEAAYAEKVPDALEGGKSLVPGTTAHTYQTDDRNQAKEMMVRAMSQTVPREANMHVIEPMIPDGLDTKKVAAQKLKDLRAYFKDQRAAFNKTLSDANVRPMGDGKSASPTPAPKSVEVTTVIAGKKYVKRGDEWFEATK